MSENGEGNATIIEFEELEAEGAGTGTSSKLSEAMAHLKEHAPEQYAKVAEILGIKTDLSNEQLLAEMKKLLKKPEEEEEEEEEEKDAASYKDFMKKCMEGGKSLKECADEYKSKGGKEASATELAEVEELAKELAKKKKPEEEEEDEYPEPVKKKMKEMADRITELEEANRLALIKNEVQELVTERHLAPIQVEKVTKLSSAMDEEMRSDFLDLFRTTQKFKVDQDVGITDQRKPGDPTDDLTPELRAQLMESHGLADLIAEKGVRKPRNN